MKKLFIKLVSQIDPSKEFYFAVGGHQGSHNWKDAILNDVQISWGVRNNLGGYAYVNWGRLEIARTEIDSDPYNMYAYIGEDEDSLELFFEGYAIREQLTYPSLVLGVYGKDYDALVLDEGVFLDRDGNASPEKYKKITFGTLLEYIPCQRVGSSSEYKYVKPLIKGTSPGTDYHVYDDGVNIDGNVTDNGDGTFNLSSAPVGEVSISGTSEYVHSTPYSPYGDRFSDSVYDFVADRISATLITTPYWKDSPTISKFVKTQLKITDLLDHVSRLVPAIAYCVGSNVYAFAIGRLKTYSTSFSEFVSNQPEEEPYSFYLNEDMMIDFKIEWPSPTKFIVGNYEYREAVLDRTGYHVKTERMDLKHDVGFAVGGEYNVGDWIHPSLFWSEVGGIHNYINNIRCRVKCNLEDVYGIKPGYILGIDVPDEFMSIFTQKFNIFVVTGININFSRYTVDLTGVWSPL